MEHTTSPLSTTDHSAVKPTTRWSNRPLGGQTDPSAV